MKKLLSYILVITQLLLLLQVNFIMQYIFPTAYALSNTWELNTPGNYTLESAAESEITGSNATLKKNLFHVGSIKNVTLLNSIDNIVVDGDYAYATSRTSDNFNIIDISTPSSPSIVATLINNGGTLRLDGASGIVKDGNYVYIASQESDAIQIIDVSTPTVPVAAAQVLNSPTSNRLNGARSIVKSGNFIYVSSQSDHAIVVIDVSSPTAPTYITNLRDTTNLRGTRDLQVSGNYLYVTSYGRDRLTTVDISTPATPFVADSLLDGTGLNGAWQVALSGNYAYVSSNLNDSVAIIDITDPTALSSVTTITNGGTNLLDQPRDLVVHNNTLFVTANTSDAINAFDISTPATPVFLDSMVHSGGSQELNGARGIFNIGDTFYVASGVSDALEIIDYRYPTTSPFIRSNTAFNYTGELISSFSETLGASHAGSITYQISKDNGTTWYYHNGSSWQTTIAGVSESTTAANINTNISAFNDVITVGTNFVWKAFLTSDGSQQVELDAINAISSAGAPGGVATDLSLWLKADEGTSTTTDSTALTSWSDQSGNELNAAGGVSPTYLSTSNHLNFNPIVDFNGTTQFLENLSGGTHTDSYFVVTIPDNEVSGTVTGGVPFGFDCFSGTLSSGTCGLSFAGIVLGAFTTAIPDEVLSHAIGSSVNWRSAQTAIEIYEGGKPMLIGVNENAGATSTDIYEKGIQVDNHTTGTYQKLSNSNYSLGKTLDATYPFFFDGKIAEVINYSGRVGDSDRAKAESYLSLKYGMTLANGSKDYVASDGSTLMWSSVTGSGYTKNIFGIGRDDLSELSQVKSQSTNNENIVTIEADNEGTNIVPSFVDISNKEFFTVSHDHGGNSWSAIDSPATYNILERKWKVQETGDVGNLDFEFNMADTDFNVPVSASGSLYYFIYDSNTNGNLNDETPLLMTNTTGEIWKTSEINMEHNQIFTIATEASGNHIPSNITISNTSINENIAIGSTIGTLSTTDLDISDTHTYSLISGAGDHDNEIFSIAGNTLTITESPDFEIQNSYSIRINTDDGNGGIYQKIFTITVFDLSETITTIIDFENHGKYEVASGNWNRTTTNPYEGAHSLESDNGGVNNTQSCFEVHHTASGTGTIEFYYNVSSEASSDFLRFYIDDVEQGSGWSGTIGWTKYSHTDIAAGLRDYKWCYIKDTAGSAGTDNAFIDYITYGSAASDAIAPTILTSTPGSNMLFPIGNNINIDFTYADNVGGSGIDISSIGLTLQKWDGVSAYGTNLFGTNITTNTVNSSNADYTANGLTFGKYRANFSVADSAGNIQTQEIIFYVDQVEFTVSTGSINLGTIHSLANTFSPTVTVTVKTVGAGFNVTMNNTELPTTGSETISAWDTSTGIGYDQSPFSSTISTINTNQNIGTQAASINTNGDKNTYTYEIQVGAIIEIQQSAGDYSGTMDFGISLDY